MNREIYKEELLDDRHKKVNSQEKSFNFKRKVNSKMNKTNSQETNISKVLGSKSYSKEWVKALAN